MSLRILVTFCASIALSSCFLKPYQMDVQQGNYVDMEMIAKLKPDMTRTQVRFILGTPLIADPFNPDRWDYLYIDRRAGRLKAVRRLTVYFEEDRLKRALSDAPVEPAPSQQRASR